MLADWFLSKPCEGGAMELTVIVEKRTGKRKSASRKTRRLGMAAEDNNKSAALERSPIQATRFVN